MIAPALISALVFSTIMAVTLGVLSYARHSQERRSFMGKLRDDGGGVAADDAGPAALSDTPIRGWFLDIMQLVGSVVRPKEEQGELSHIQKRFFKAGYRNKNAVIVFFGSKVFCAAFFMLLAFAAHFFGFARLAVLPLLLCCGLVSLIGFCLPNLWLRQRISRRKERITMGFPDALDLLVVCTEAGMGLDAAMKRVGEEMSLRSKTISDEFKLLNLELRAGKSRRDALRNLGLRTGLEEVNSLVTLLVQTDKFGTSVAQALRVHSEGMRAKRSQRVEEIAAKLPVKLLFPTIFFIFPSLFVVLLGPSAIQIFRLWSSY